MLQPSARNFIPDAHYQLDFKRICASSCPMKYLLLFSLLAHTPVISQAKSFNCKTLWEKGYPDMRFPEGLDCELSEKFESAVGTAEVYHYAKGFPLSPEDTGFSFRAGEVFKDVSDKIIALREESSVRLRFKPLAFIFTTQSAASTEIAMVRVGHAGDEESCPVVVYIDSFKKQSADRQRQMLAHEIFHCIQDKLWVEKITFTPERVHEWWSEGSAVWFSNLVYPTFNQEFDYNDDYQGDTSLVLQKPGNSYAAYLFFQSFSFSWLGVDGVLDMIEDLPTTGGTTEQIYALLNVPSIELFFNRFAEHITSNQIKDFSGPAMNTSLSTLTDTYTIKEGENKFNWFHDFFTIKITEIILPPKTIVRIEKTNSPDSAVNYMATRNSGTAGTWNELFPSYPTSINMSCKATSRNLDLLSAYGGDDPLNDEFTLKVTAEKAECHCVEKVEFDPCLIGDYELDKPSLDKVFARIFNNKNYVVENSSGGYSLSVSSGQKFSFTETDFSASVIVKDETFGDIRVLVTMNGTTDAFSKLLAKDEICFSDIGADYNIRIQVFLPYGVSDTTNPYSNFDEFIDGSTKFRCSKEELILIRMLPTGPDGSNEPQELRFIRK